MAERAATGPRVTSTLAIGGVERIRVASAKGYIVHSEAKFMNPYVHTQTSVKSGIIVFLFAVILLGGVILWWTLSPEASTRHGVGEEASQLRPDKRMQWLSVRNPKTGEVPANIRVKELAFVGQLPARARKSQSWIQRGPYEIGGRTRALALDVRDENVILAGAVSGGIWRSVDGGASWTKTTDPDQLHSVTKIIQDTRSGKRHIWYASTGEYAGSSRWLHGNGVYKSTDGGRSWTLVSNASTSKSHEVPEWYEYIWNIALDPSNTDDDELYAATYGNIYRSLDGGATWRSVLDGVHRSWGATDVIVTSSGTMYAALKTGILRSETGDFDSWNDIAPSDLPSNVIRIVLAPSSNDESEIWALGSSFDGGGPNGHFLWRYDSTSQMWSDFTDYLPDEFRTQAGYDQVIAVHPEEEDILILGGVGLYRVNISRSASEAVTRLNGTGVDHHVITFSRSNGDETYVGNDGGVHKTSNILDAQTIDDWISLENGYVTTQFYSVCYNAEETTPTVAGGMQDNSSWLTPSASPDADWIPVGGGDGGECDIITKENSTNYVYTTATWTLSRAEYEKGSWEEVPRSRTRIDPPGLNTHLFWNSSWQIDPNDHKVMLLGVQDVIWRNTNVEGDSPRQNWEKLFAFGNTDFSNTIASVEISQADKSHVLYFGSHGGQVFRLEDANAVSAPAAPVEITGNAFPDGGSIKDIAIHPDNSDKVLVVFSNYGIRSVFYTEDGGETWTDVSGNLEENPDGSGSGPSVRSATILPQEGLGQTTYFVGTSMGLYSTMTLDASNTIWRQEGPSTIGNIIVEQVKARPTDGRVFVATHGNGVYSSDLPLPVELVDLEARRREDSVVLTWRTTSETNNSGFEVQRRATDGGFQRVSFVEGSGTSSEPRTYRYSDRDLPYEADSLTYRLKQVDFDGSFEYSNSVGLALGSPERLVLHGNFPNPFADQTKIRYEVPTAGPVHLGVYDALGRRVATLVDERQAAGRQAVDFDARELASGTYFYRLEAGDHVATQSMTVVR